MGEFPVILQVVFPACAGINRTCLLTSRLAVRVPRMRGDEPDRELKQLMELMVFPACAGMNR